MTNIELKKHDRTFLPQAFKITWETIAPLYKNLLDRKLDSVIELEKWMQDRSELEAALEEDFAWRYIRMTCDTTNEELTKSFQYFATEIEPKTSEFSHKLNEKLLTSPFLEELDSKKYFIYLRNLKNQYKLFRQENIPLFTEIQLEQQKYGAIAGAMTIDYNDHEYTLEQAANFLKEQNRDVRKEVYEKIQARRLQDRNTLNDLFNKLVALRHKVAINAGYENYRDYMFSALGRFDYTPNDCFLFHEAIENEVTPLLKLFAEERKNKMNLSSLEPYDTEVDISGKPALKPFQNAEELINKTIRCFSKIHPYMGECLETMKSNQLLDLESRKGKAPGGYNYPLAETGAPFIFMNSANSMRDLTTIMHEGGHAVHTFISNDLPLNDFKHLPSEVAEVASMSMELISMDYWSEFLSNSDELRRAKEDQLKDVLKTFPWVAAIDSFQHWIYTHPQHTNEERDQAWEEIFDRFGASFVDWINYPNVKHTLWQKQLHLFEVPFYYIEYAIAQLAAIAIYKHYKENPKETITNYLSALKLGYTKTIKEIYEIAGIRFDFSETYIKELVQFIKNELEELKK